MNNEDIAIYFGQKGYTIYKKNLIIKDKINSQKTVSPYVPKILKNQHNFQYIENLLKNFIYQNIMDIKFWRA